MNRFRVQVKTIQVFEVDIEADSTWQASDAADALPVEGMVKVRNERESMPLKEYGPIKVQTHHIERILVFNTPFGCVFTQEDVDAILELVAEHVGPVVDHWNGLRCTTFSVQTVATVLEDQEEAVRKALRRRFVDRSLEAAERAAQIIITKET